MRLDWKYSARLALVTAGAVAASVVITGPAFAVAPAGSTVFINELHYDNAGADAGEQIEVAAPSGTDLGDWSLVLYNGSGGAVYNTTPLSGVVPGASGEIGVLSFAITGIQNGAPDGMALVGPAGLEQFLSYEGSFVAVGGPADGQTSTDIGVAETGSGPIGESLSLIGSGSTYGDFTWQASAPATFGAVNTGQTFGASEPPPPPPPPPTTPCAVPPAITPISTVQGNTATTPCAAAASVTVEGVVVGDYEGPSPALRGFYVQEQDADVDADSSTSEGIFVFNGNNDSVNLGDVVTVTGPASEFQGQTQISATSVVVDDTAAVVSPAEVSLPLPSSDYLERNEGMLVVVPQTLTVTETFQLGRFGEIVVSSDGRLPQPTDVAEPGAPAQAVQAANDLNRLKIDDDNNAQNVDPIRFGRNGDPLTADNTLRGGDTVTGAVGVLTYTWAGNSASGNAYRLRPIGDLSDSGLVAGGVVPDFAPANPRPSDAPEVGGSLQVGAFNVLNYFLTLDASGNLCGPTGSTAGCRGAETSEEFQRQRDKLLSALLELDADVLGLVELENTTGVEPLADIVDGLNAAAGAGTYAYVETGTIGTDVIKVGIIFKPESATPIGDYATLDKNVDPRFNSDRMRPSLAQSFRENATGEVFTLVVNHFKSKGCRESSGLDTDQGDGQGCWNPTRTAAAEALRDWVDSGPTGVQDDDVMLVGDFNSYAKEDPIDVLVDAGFVDLADSLIGPDAYSYVFNGQWGYLDYALASPSLVAQVTGAAEYHINADEPGVLDYNTNFKTVAQVDYLYAPDEFRTSDHDPVLVGLDLDGLPGSNVTADPDRLWPPNHKYQRVDVTGQSSAGDPLSVTIVSATSSEPDCGGSFGDRCQDIVMVDQDSLDLRSERYSPEGRTYTLEVSVTDGSQTVYTTIMIRVANR